MKMIYYWYNRNGGHSERPVKMHPLSKKHQIHVFFKFLLYQLPGHAMFFKFLVLIINHYHINGLHLIWDSFEWFRLQISSCVKYFLLFCLRHWDRGLIVVIVDTIFKSEAKKKTTLLLVELLAVTWILCILRHSIMLSHYKCNGKIVHKHTQCRHTTEWVTSKKSYCSRMRR